MLKRRKIFHEISLATVIVAVCATLSVTYALLNINSDALKLSAREYASSISENLSYKILNEITTFENALKEITNIFNNSSLTATDKIEITKSVIRLDSIKVIGIFDNKGKKRDAISSEDIRTLDSIPEDMYKYAI